MMNYWCVLIVGDSNKLNYCLDGVYNHCCSLLTLLDYVLLVLAPFSISFFFLYLILVPGKGPYTFASETHLALSCSLCARLFLMCVCFLVSVHGFVRKQKMKGAGWNHTLKRQINR